MKKIFICHNVNTYGRSDEIEQELEDKGYVIMNPHATPLGIKRNVYDYINVNLMTLAVCDTICIMDGWENNETSRLYRLYAKVMDKDIIYQTPPTEEKRKKKYLWVLRGLPKTYSSYLNLRTEDNIVLVGNSDETDTYHTKFTESEYKELAEQYHFSEDMFIREEIE